MRRLSIRIKITLWFGAALFIIAGAAILSVLSISGSVIQKGIRDDLVETVTSNINEVVFFHSLDDVYSDSAKDIYLTYADGVLEIDKDYLDRVNGIYTALYDKSFTLLYGEDPTALRVSELPFLDGGIRTVEVNNVRYYVYDCRLSGNGLEDLWLRGVVSHLQGSEATHDIANLSLLLLPALVVMALLGGYLLAGRLLRPVRRIGDTAEAIRVGNDLSQRIALGEGRDELHRLAHTFDDMLDRLEQSFRAEQHFTSDASHELRTPVSVIIAQCEYTLSKERDSKAYIQALEQIHAQGKRMSVMVEDMLFYTRMEQNPEAVAMNPLNLSETVSAMCEDMAIVADKGITLTADIEPDIRIIGNEQLLSRMLMNMITNSFRYGNEGGHTAVRLERRDDVAVISVADDGVGIKEEDIDKIWDRFYQADASRRSKGSGLGLSMVRQIAQLHGGGVGVESVFGEGSIFTVRIPCDSD